MRQKLRSREGERERGRVVRGWGMSQQEAKEAKEERVRRGKGSDRHEGR